VAVVHQLLSLLPHELGFKAVLLDFAPQFLMLLQELLGLYHVPSQLL
jgi:hypothetical protein